MPLGAILAVALAAAGPGGVRTDPNLPRRLWSGRGVVVSAEHCDPRSRLEDEEGFCVVRQSRAHRAVIPISAAPSRTKLIWRKEAGVDGPDLLIEADSGGSAGCIEVIGVSARDDSPVRKLQACHTDAVKLRRSRRTLSFTVNLDVESFNSAANAVTAAAPAPVIWRDGRFTFDLSAAAKERFTALDLSFRSTAISYDLQGWINADYAGRSTPIASQALLELIVNGHAATAHRLLLDASRYDRGFGAEAFWADLCLRVVRNPLWKDLRMDRLPEADVVIAAARNGRRDRSDRDYLSGSP